MASKVDLNLSPTPAQLKTLSYLFYSCQTETQNQPCIFLVLLPFLPKSWGWFSNLVRRMISLVFVSHVKPCMTSHQRKTLSPLKTPTLGHCAARMDLSQDGHTKWNATKPLTRQCANAMKNLDVQLQKWRKDAGRDGLLNTVNVIRDICGYIEESSLGCREICIIVAIVRYLRRGRSNITDVAITVDQNNVNTRVTIGHTLRGEVLSDVRSGRNGSITALWTVLRQEWDKIRRIRGTDAKDTQWES